MDSLFLINRILSLKEAKYKERDVNAKIAADENTANPAIFEKAAMKDVGYIDALDDILAEITQADLEALAKHSQ